MEPIVAELLERLAHAEVEPRPPLIRDRARDRVASERVAEHVHLPLRGRALEELRFDRRGEIADELVLGSVREGDNDLVRQRDGGDRERLQEVRGPAAALLREPRHAHLDRVADAPRNRRAVGARLGVIDRGLEKLLHVERDAFGALEHGPCELVGRAFGQQRLGHALDARGVERLESDTSESALAIELGHERTQWMGRTDIFLAVGEEDADPAVKRRREIAQKVAARGICLVEIVEYDKDRTKRGGVLEEEMDRAKESLATLVVRDRPLV